MTAVAVLKYKAIRQRLVADPERNDLSDVTELLLMRKPVIAGNWKMYKLLSEAVDTALALKPLVANANHCEVIIAPVFTALKTVADRLEGSNIRVAGQNCSAEQKEG